MPDAIRVLYVDDESGLLEIGKLFLEIEGSFVVDTLTSAIEALELLKTERYDAIVSDYEMPDMDGITFLKQLKASGNITPFIIFTGKGREEVVIEALNNGADFYLQKGFAPKTLYTELSHFIRQSVLMRRTQLSLEEQEQRYHDIQNANDLIQSVAPDGHFLFVNKKWLITLGYEEHDLPNLTIFDIIDNESLNHCMELFKRVISGENIGIINAIFRTRDGRRVYVEGMANCRIVEGKPLYTRGIFKDVTEQKKADAALKESEAKYRNVVEDQTEFISRFRPDGTHVFVNDAYCRYYHKLRTDLIGKRFVTDIPAEERSLVRQHFASLTQERPVATITHRVILPDGRLRWQQWSNRAIFDDEGHVLEYQSVGRDITDLKESEHELLRKNEEVNAAFEELTATEEELRHNYELISQKEQALRESEVRFRTLIESSPIAILVARKGCLEYANTIFYRQIRVEQPATVQGKNLLSFIAPEYRQKVAGYIEARQRGESAPLFYEAVGLRSDGTRIPFEINIADIHLSDGPASLAFINDISARKRAEEELQAATEQLIASQEELRGQFDELVQSDRLVRESEVKFRTLFNNTDDEIYVHETLPDGMPGKFLEVNDCMCNRLGYSREELLTMTVYDIVSEAHLKKMAGIKRELLKTGKYTFYGEHKRKDGTVFPVEINIHRFTFFGKEIVLAAARDITDRKKIEDALCESEETFRALVEQSSEGIIIVDFLGKLLFANGRAWDIIEYPQDRRTIGTFNVLEIISPELQDNAVNDFLQVSKGIDRYTVHYKVITPDKKEKWIECIGKKISHKDSPAMLLSFRDATERKKEELAVQENEKKFRTIFENSLFPISINSIPDGKFVAVNAAFLENSGYTESEVLGKNPVDLGLLSLLDFGKFTSRLLLSGKIENMPMTMTGKGGIRVQVLFSTLPIKINDRPAILTMTVNVTKLKIIEEELVKSNEQLQTAFKELAASEAKLRQNFDDLSKKEHELRSSEERYRALYNNNPIMLFTLDHTGKVLSVNHAGVRQLGYKTGELEGQSVLNVFYPEDRSAVTEQLQICLKSPGEEFHWQFRKVRKDGKMIWVDEHARAIPGFAENLSVLVVCQDITDQKRMEDALRKSEKKYRDIIDKMQDVVYRTDRDGKLIMFSPHGVKLAGYDSEEEMLGFDVAFDTYLDPKDREQFLAALKEKGFVENYPLVLKARYGVPRLVTASSHFYYDDDGTVLGVEGILHDITDISKKEKELRSSEERYRALYNNNPIMLFTLDPEGKVISVNHSGTSQLGYSDGELEGQPVLNVFYPDDRCAVTEQLQICLKSPGEGFHWQFRKVRKDGRMIWVDEHARAIVSSEGELSVLVVCQDITEKKTIEDELRLLKVSVDRAADEVFWLDFEGNILYVNDSACRITGYSREEFLAMKIFKLDPDFTREIWDKAVAELRQKKTLLLTTRHQRKDGVMIDVEIMSVYVSKDDKEYSFAFVRDISWRKEAERALIESDKRSRLFLQSANDAILIHEISEKGPGRLIEVNDQACQILGYSREELLNMSIPDIDVLEQKSQVPEILEKLHSTGKVVFQTEFMTKDGRRIPIEDSNRLINLDGRPAVLCIARDLSEQKRTEQVLQDANRKLNLLSSITRHDILNKIAVLSGYLNLAKDMKLDPTMAQYVEKMDTVTNSIIQHIEFTRVYQDLGTTAPQWQDLSAVLPRSLVPKNVTLYTDLPGVKVYADPILKTVFSNLLDNTLRHGKQTKTITVSTHESSEGLIIVWEDDGIGIPVKEKEKIFRKGYGKNTGLGLFLSKEILSITGITIRETGEPGKGARFEMTVPKRAYQFTGTGQE